MRSKLPKRCWLSSILLAAAIGGTIPRAEAVSILPYGVVNPMVDDGDGTSSTVYYLDAATYAGQIATGYTGHGFNTGEDFQFAISGAGGDATKPYTWVYAETTTSGEYKAIPLSGCNGLPMGATGSCNNGANDVFILTIDFANVCATVSAIKGCASGIVAVTGSITGFRLRVLNGTSAAPGTALASAGTQIKIIPQVAGPDVTTPSGAGFFPGDGSILIETGGITAIPDAATGSSPVFLKDYVAAQKGGTVTDGSETSATLVRTVDYQSGEQEVTGFENSSSTAQTFYEMKLGVQDSAGAIGFSPTHYANVFATDIQGFLRESNCFVATASYRSGRAPGVMLLRHFRDEVLANSDLGRGFIGWYYRYGPIAADWLIAHPIFRSVSLMALMPLQAIAWIALHPTVLLVPLLALFVLIGFFARGAGLGFLLLAALVIATPRALAVDQPYIDSLISELPKDQFPPTTGNPDPYLQSIKAKIGNGEDADGYTAEVKKQIGSDDPSAGYTQRLQQGLDPHSGSAIEDYRNGKKLRANKGSLDTRSAFGFNVMASATRTYTAGERQDIAYESVYGNKWVPDFTLHYEWRPFTSAFLKKFGLYSSAGASFTTANGILNYQDTRFGSESRTQFRFIVLPVNVGLIYRFSLFGFMWPYFAGGPSAIGFIESRNDKQPSHHGYDFGYWFSGGVAFGLDWLSPKSSWDQYESTGVKHSYFSIDYSYLESVSGGLVQFTVDGVRAGFTFEL